MAGRSLPGHLGGEGEESLASREGEVLEGDRYIDLALAELKKLPKKTAQAEAETAPAARAQ